MRLSGSSFILCAAAAMSYAEPLPDAGSAIGVEQSATLTKRAPLRRRRLDLIYFALAGFDVMTIALTLMLSNHIMDLYQQSVHRSAAWSARVGQLAELAAFAQDANAPGNDVFDSHDVLLERSRRDSAHARYKQQRDRILADLATNARADTAQRLSERLRVVDYHMGEMLSEADRIFAEIEAGDDEAAGRRMATMDRVYGRLTRGLLDSIVTVQQIEDAHLRRQAELAAEMRRLEFVVMGLIFLIVVGVTLYGRRIGQIMRQTEDAHNDMVEELETANTSLQQYADNVAHELRSPVNKVLLASEIALSRPRSSEEYQDTLVSIVEESQRLSSIVASLLFLARARRTRVDLERQTVDVGAELATIRAYFETAAHEAGVDLAVECAANCSIGADRTLFQRAVCNLVANAISHTPAGGAVRIGVRDGRDKLVVEVTDTGEGVSAEDQTRVFDRFYRADKARIAASGRLGLGLPITQSIMNLHGGSISMRSALGLGTVVTLEFPRSTSADI
jgi:two-component system, OmpR family, heavy metal sensor histidine kinase CusS